MRLFLQIKPCRNEKNLAISKVSLAKLYLSPAILRGQVYFLIPPAKSLRGRNINFVPPGLAQIQRLVQGPGLHYYLSIVEVPGGGVTNDIPTLRLFDHRLVEEAARQERQA